MNWNGVFRSASFFVMRNEMAEPEASCGSENQFWSRVMACSLRGTRDCKARPLQCAPRHGSSLNDRLEHRPRPPDVLDPALGRGLFRREFRWARRGEAAWRGR